MGRIRQVLSDKRSAPRLLIDMQCPECGRGIVVDVYLGVVMCGRCKGKPFMEPVELVGLYPSIDEEAVVVKSVVVEEVRSGYDE